MNLPTAADRLAVALIRACEEHGRPNSFSPRELFEFHGGPSPRLAGRAIKECHKTFENSLEARGWKGPFPIYVDRVFQVQPSRMDYQT